MDMRKKRKSIIMAAACILLVMLLAYAFLTPMGDRFRSGQLDRIPARTVLYCRILRVGLSSLFCRFLSLPGVPQMKLIVDAV